jgi:ATP-dependent exoDNAse (exonuclease V) beta subunit
MSIKLLSASAGSGKTFNIAMFYIYLALKNEKNYSKILALTFTNAAVNEMKSRIIKYLHLLSNNDTKTISDFKKYLSNNNLYSDDIVKDIHIKAKNILLNIVYNYYSFSIYTIDSFLQKILSSCLFELNYHNNYTLIVDNNNLIDDVISDFLIYPFPNDNIQLKKWLEEFIKYKISLNKNIYIKDELTKLANEINKEFYYFNKDKLKLEKNNNKLNDIKQKLDKIQENFVEELHEISNEFVQLCQKNNLTKDDFIKKSKGIANILETKFREFKKGNDVKSILSTTLKDFIDNGKWFQKEKETNITIEFEKLYHKIKSCKEKSNEYETARLIEKNIFLIGLIQHIIDLLDDYKNKNEILLLSDVAKILLEFIKENYLFIYEKLGVKYEYFLIDEFQDTSKLQYLVLKPLLEESLSQANSQNILIVGDIKQAIYRWRNGNWKIMQNDLEKDFNNNIIKESLEFNFRSKPNIINFNNIIFTQLKEKLKDEIKDELKEHLNDIYKDCIQKYPQDKPLDNNFGFVKVILPDNLNNNNNKFHTEQAEEPEEQEENSEDKEKWLIKEIENLIDKNYSNIGILVRTNTEAKKIFKLLSESESSIIKEQTIVSKESITYRSSLVVEWLMHYLHFLYTKSSQSEYVMNTYIKDLIKGQQQLNEFLNSLPSITNENTPLYLMVENIFQHLFSYKEIPEGEKIFALNFMEKIENLIYKQGNSEKQFVDWYFKQGRDETIMFTSKEKGIFIETIHSSKGLQYEAVIIPYVNWPKRNISDEYLWEDNNLNTYNINNDLPTVLLKYEKSLENSHFQEAYETELFYKKIDNANLLYVAFTRPMNALIINIENSGIGKDLINILNDDSFLNININIDNQNKKIIDFKDNNTFIFGELIPLNQSKEIKIKTHYTWTKTNIPNFEIVVKEDDFLKYDDEILHGNLIHKIIEKINDINNWKIKAEKILSETNIPEKEKIKILSKLEKLFAKDSLLYSWYLNSKKIISEQSIINNNDVRRPDKIFINDEKTIIVDFKTGKTELSHYKSQIENYTNLLKTLGYNNVESYIVNVDTEEILKL